MAEALRPGSDHYEGLILFCERNRTIVLGALPSGMAELAQRCGFRALWAFIACHGGGQVYVAYEYAADLALAHRLVPLCGASAVRWIVSNLGPGHVSVASAVRVRRMYADDFLRRAVDAGASKASLAHTWSVDVRTVKRAVKRNAAERALAGG